MFMRVYAAHKAHTHAQTEGSAAAAAHAARSALRDQWFNGLHCGALLCRSDSAAN